MLFSFFIYLTAAFLMFQWGKLCVPASGISLKQQAERNFLGQFLFIVTFVFITGARYNVGVDYMSYLSIYQDLVNIGKVSDAYEPLFVNISLFIANLDLHFFFFFAFWAFIQIFFVCRAVKHERELLPFIGAFIFLHTFFLDWTNGLRQCIVECIFFWALLFVKQKKLIIYLFIIYICTFIHTSAFLLMPFCLLAFINISPKRKNLLLLIFLTCTIIGSTPIWINLLSPLSDYLSQYGFDRYASNLNRQLDNEDLLRETAWGPSRLSIFIINGFIIYLAPKIKEHIKNPRTMFSIYFSLFYIGATLYELFVNTTHIFLRPVGYFTYFRLPMLAYVSIYLWKSNKKFLFASFILLAFMPTASAIIKGALSPQTTNNLYHFFFLM